jgi:putative tricarboxylic transport membrane protein
MADDTMARRVDRPALVVAALLLVTAALVAFDASRQTITSNYGVGPTAMPYVVCTGLTLLGLAHLFVAFRDGIPKPEAADNSAILWIVAGLAGLLACIALGGGFIVAMTIVFACTARGFGRRALLVDAVIGFVLGLVIFVMFSRLLTLTLPSGPLERLLT